MHSCMPTSRLKPTLLNVALSLLVSSCTLWLSVESFEISRREPYLVLSRMASNISPTLAHSPSFDHEYRKGTDRSCAHSRQIHLTKINPRRSRATRVLSTVNNENENVTGNGNTGDETSTPKASSEDVIPKPAIIDNRIDKENISSSSSLRDILPWGDFQEWALRDNLPKYLVRIPQIRGGGGPDGHTFALWHSMTCDITEFSGYDIAFIREKHQMQIDRDAYDLTKQDDNYDNASNKIFTNVNDNAQGVFDNAPHRSSANSKELNAGLTVTPGALPLIDQFLFLNNGGIAGSAYDIPGIADGTNIQSPILIDAQDTIPKGYVIVKSNDRFQNYNDIRDKRSSNINEERKIIAYELGIPAGDFDSFSGAPGPITFDKRMKMLKGIAPILGIQNADVQMEKKIIYKNSDSNIDADTKFLLNIGATTAIVLAAGTAINSLSHHLTINVFWV
mmetsp:Transcript_7603/g.10897  ORF Transcript_7603/g.10897 Transcript_7603/m.10897 type:complete len:449 (+) Transcript_7603:68-1414(+)